jgi:hypothetical protein
MFLIFHAQKNPMCQGGVGVRGIQGSRGCMRSPFFWRRKSTITLGFLLPWISPLIFVGFLLSSPPYAWSFLRKPSFLVLVDFFPWFFKSKQLLGFLGVVFMLKQGPNKNIIFYLNIIIAEYSKEDIQSCQ